MATATMATAVGAAVLVYLNLNRKIQSEKPSEDEELCNSDSQENSHLGVDRISRKLIQAPATWLETITTLAETLRFTYSETLGKWPIADLAFGISFLLRRQGNLQVSSVFASEDSVEINGPEVVDELHDLLHLLTLCWHFSKKPFPLFLELTGYTKEDVLLQEPKAGILKPAFTVLIDHKSSCFLLLIRGTHSIKDTLTAANGAVVPFHHTVVNDGGVASLVLGYAHCGMVAAARWISKLSSPCLKSAVKQYPDYKVKIVGHSLGGGTAALLTYVLREQKELSSTTCVTFAPGACMTWELAESGTGFVTCVINGADLVPSFSAASVDDLRAEVTASAWLNDLRNQIEQTRILSTVYRSASTLGSIGAGAIRPVSTGTQVVMKRASSMARAAWTTSPSWSCMGARKCVPVRCSEKCPDEFSNVDDGTDGGIRQMDEGVREKASSSMGKREEIKEVHRFYPPGRIMHIVSVNGSSSSSDSDARIGVFLTSRKLYSKIRLSQTMVRDHFMPAYRCQIERLLEQSSDLQSG